RSASKARPNSGIFCGALDPIPGIHRYSLSDRKSGQKGRCMMAEIHDLRSALAYLKTRPGQLLETDTEADPDAEISGVYRYVGAGGTVMRPTKEGPAMLFNHVKGFDDARVAIGLLASRKRVADLLGLDAEHLGIEMAEKLKHTIAPEMVAPGTHIDCQEQVYRADDPDFDLRKLVPAPTNTPEDAGPYITMGLAMGTDPENGTSDVTIHRFCIEGRDTLAMFITPGSRHLGAFLWLTSPQQLHQWKETGSLSIS
ncbi:MAG: UbiD family decarboxylase domain-containing protein, partial [Oxalobacter sp.]